MFDELIHYYMRVPYRLRLVAFRTPKRPRATVVLLHGLGASSEMWRPIADRLPDDVRVLAVDLVGFGESPQPSKAHYSARMQAKAVLRTLRRAGTYQRPIIVGHSLGGLVAVECARIAKRPIRQLILCSPPFYHPDKLATKRPTTPDAALMRLYEQMGRDPERALSVLQFASRLGIINPAFRVDSSNISAYLATLNAAIINQSSYNDALRLTVPTQIVFGRFDMLVIGSNLRRLVKQNPAITLHTINAAHEIRGTYQRTLIKLIKSVVQ